MRTEKSHRSGASASSSWAAILTAARLRPAFYVGDEDTAHLLPVRGLSLMTDTPAFVSTTKADVRFSEYSIVSRAFGGPLDPRIEELVGLDGSDVMLRAMVDAGRSLARDPFPDPHFEPLKYIQLGLPALPLFLADYGTLAIQVPAGMYYQVYRYGWPICPPTLMPLHNDVNLLVACVFTPTFFNGLPLAAEAIRSSCPESRFRISIARDEGLVLSAIAEPRELVTDLLTSPNLED